MGASNPDQIYETLLSLAPVEKLTAKILEENNGILGNMPPAVKRRQAMS